MRLSTAILFSIAVVAAGQTGGAQYVNATDARGVKHVIDSSVRAPAPWKPDLLFAPKPGYPRIDLVQRNEGVAVIRLDVDIKTGTTTYVTLLKSSGSPTLDETALRSLAKWRWKPGTWKQVEIPVVFTTNPYRIRW